MSKLTPNTEKETPVKKLKNIDQNLKIALGIDIGHSKVKYGFAYSHKPAEHYIDSFPTIVIPYFDLHSKMTKEKAKQDMVSIIDEEGKERQFYIGNTARTQGESTSYTGEDQSWIETVEHDVLILGAWKRIQDKIKNDFETKIPKHFEITLGLPTQYYAQQEEILIKRATRIIEKELVTGQTFNINVLPQSEALLAFVLLDKDGLPSKRNLENENFGIIESGQQTTDINIYYRGQIIQNKAISTVGGKFVHSYVAQNTPFGNLNDAVEEVVETGKIYYKGAIHDYSEVLKQGAEKFAQNVIEKCKSIFDEYKDRLRLIFLAGGGAAFLKEELEKIYPDNLQMIDDSRHAVVESFIRNGLYQVNVVSVYPEAKSE